MQSIDTMPASIPAVPHLGPLSAADKSSDSTPNVDSAPDSVPDSDASPDATTSTKMADSTPERSAPQDGARWFSCAASNQGHVRKVNEDSFLDAQEQSLWVVADGMGGHSRGDRASQCIVEALHTFEASTQALESVDDLLNRLRVANQACRQAAQGQVMGSTVAVLYLHDDSAYLLWAGDSRVYRHRNNTFNQLTDDHSLVQELHRLGELTADEAENHPSSNVITRAIGVADDIDVQVRKVDLESGDRFLLCSDGLFKDVKQHEVAANLALPSPRQALDELVKLALRRGGTDNVTAIVVQVATA